MNQNYVELAGGNLCKISWSKLFASSVSVLKNIDFLFIFLTPDYNIY